MLDGTKDGWGAPTDSSETRLAGLVTLEARQKVAVEHAVFLARAKRARENAERIELAGNVAQILNKNKQAPTASSILDAMLSTVDRVMQSAVRNIDATIQAFGLIISVTLLNSSWGELPGLIQCREAYILTFSTSAASGHAIAVYRTYGWVSTDYYVFDPNFGEFRASGDDDLIKLMGILMSTPEYNDPARVSVRNVKRP
jgi:hypothetical protein